MQIIACKTEKLAQLEKISTDGVTSVSIFFHLWCVFNMQYKPVGAGAGVGAGERVGVDAGARSGSKVGAGG